MHVRYVGRNWTLGGKVLETNLTCQAQNSTLNSSYVWGLVFLRCGASNSYVWRLVYLRLGFKDSYVLGLVFLPLRVSNSYV